MRAVATARDGEAARAHGARPLVVVHCLDSFAIGGTEMNAVRTLERLDRTAYDLRVLCLSRRGPLLERVERLGIPVEERAVGSLLHPRALGRITGIARWLRAIGADVVHAHDVYSNMIVVPAARWAGVPLVIASRRWWTTETNRALHRTLNRWSYALAHRALANSPAVAALLERDEGVPARKVVVIPNFIDDEALAPPSAEWVAARRAEIGLAPGDAVVGIVANLTAIKNHAMALRAVAALTPRFGALRLVLVGEGGERARLEQLARSLGIEAQVRFAGHRPNQPSMHWLFDVSLLTSRAEGFPNAVVEAMAAARAVVATDVGGVRDALVDGVTGRLVPSDDVHALATAIGDLLDDEALRRRLGEAGKGRACEVYHARAVMQRLGELYDEARH